MLLNQGMVLTLLNAVVGMNVLYASSNEDKLPAASNGSNSFFILTAEDVDEAQRHYLAAMEKKQERGLADFDNVGEVEHFEMQLNEFKQMRLSRDNAWLRARLVFLNETIIPSLRAPTPVESSVKPKSTFFGFTRSVSFQSQGSAQRSLGEMLNVEAKVSLARKKLHEDIVGYTKRMNEAYRRQGWQLVCLGNTFKMFDNSMMVVDAVRLPVVERTPGDEDDYF